MKYRRIGTTTLELSELGFSCGDAMLRGSPEDQTAIAARALEAGINYFDISPRLADGQAETNLGHALKQLQHKPVLASRVEIHAEDLDDIAGRVVRSAEASLQRLGVDCLDILHIYNGPTGLQPRSEGELHTHLWIEDFLEPGGAVDGMLRLKRDGKIRHLGFVCHGNDGVEARQLLDTGMFSIVTVAYSCLNPSAGRAMPDGLRGVPDFGNVISEALAHGAGAAVHSPSSIDAPGDEKRAAAIEFLARELGLSDSQASVRFALDHPAVTSVLAAFATPQQVSEMMAAVDATGFTTQQMARLEAVWRNNFGL